MEEQTPEATSVSKKKRRRHWKRWVILIGLISGGGYYLLQTQQKNTASVVSELTARQNEINSKPVKGAPAEQVNEQHIEGDPTHSLIQAPVVDLKRIAKISRYRSAAVIPYVDGSDETCRSLRHTFAQPTPDPAKRPANYLKLPPSDSPIAVMSPVEGTIVSVEDSEQGAGMTMTIRPVAFPRIDVVLDRIFPTGSFTAGSVVTAGQTIGSLGAYSGLDVSIEVPSGAHTDYFSYFEVMPDTLFNQLSSYGLKRREQIIIDRATRDEKPFTCSGNAFTNHDVDDPGDWLTLTTS